MAIAPPAVVPQTVVSPAVVVAPPPNPGPTRVGAEALAEIAATVDAVPDPARRAVPGPPLLASEALMEDLAPVEPARRGARAWCLGVGGASLAFAALPIVGLLPGGAPAAIPWLVTGAITLVAGLTVVTYRQRAVAMVVLGLLSGVVALHGADGLLKTAGGGAGWALARLAAAIALPAALLFRGRYRAYAGARVFLGTAIALSLPTAGHAVMALFATTSLATVGAVAVLAMLAASLVGFMGAETTGAGTYLAPAAVVTFTVDLALAGLALHGPLLGIATGSVAFGFAAALAALGVFQILAWRFAADARRIDIHSRPRESSPPSDDRDTASDWSTRD